MINESTIPMFVYFDDDGNILKIANYKDEDEKFITVTYFEVSKILDGTEVLSDFKIEKDASNILKMVKIQVRDTNSYNVNDRIYLVPKNNQQATFYVYQDLKNSQWIFDVSSSFRKLSVENNVFVEPRMFFSVTRENDPNILYRFIEVDFAKVLKQKVKIKFKYQEEATPEVQIYTHKKVDSYTHEVINE